LVQLLRFKPGNQQIYTQALKHKSFDNINNNERLEFLGDAILNFVVSEYLFSNYPNQEEGFLSQQRAIIVGRKHLNKVGKKTINSSKIKSNLKTIPERVFGNTLEAIIGAIYIDKGIEKTKQFIIHTIINSKFIEEFSGIDFKSELQKQIQKKKQKIITQVKIFSFLYYKKIIIVYVKAKSTVINRLEPKFLGISPFLNNGLGAKVYINACYPEANEIQNRICFGGNWNTSSIGGNISYFKIRGG